MVEQKFDRPAVQAALEVDEVAYLGTGTYGESWLANGRAVKIFHNSGHRVDRLEREIASHKRVDNENVVKLYDAKTVTLAGKRLVALEFEYIDGGSLAAVISSSSPSSEILRGFACGVLSGVKALHEANLLHRDIKPDNIALRGGDLRKPVILDLGLAKLLDVESITQYPSFIGSAMYMAPEQLRSERALKASDLWAVGVVLFELATGRHPFFEEGVSMSMEEALQRLAQDVTIPPDLPLDLTTLIRKLLSDPAYRRGTVNKALRLLVEKD